MSGVPDYKNRSPEEIVGEEVYIDSVGYLYRAVSWLDYFDRTNLFTVLQYSCLDARLGVEHLLFEELVMSTGLQLSREDYKRCLKSPTKIKNLIKRISPDYQKLKEFNRVVLGLERKESDNLIPNVVFWDIPKLMKDWGKFSKYIHWFGATTETTDKADWVENARNDMGKSLLSIWNHACSGPTGLIHFNDMKQPVREIWDDYRNGTIDISSAKMRLIIIRCVL